MFGLGSQELLVILVIVLVLFGANRLPQIARSLGSSLKEAKAEDPRVVPPRDDRAAPPSVARSCGHCASALAPDWTHCPRCGTAATQEPASPPRI